MTFTIDGHSQDNGPAVGACITTVTDRDVVTSG